jgi:hypothetical protein
MDFTGLLKSDLPAFLNLRFAADRAVLFEANRKPKEPAGKPFVRQDKTGATEEWRGGLSSVGFSLRRKLLSALRREARRRWRVGLYRWPLAGVFEFHVAQVFRPEAVVSLRKTSPLKRRAT